MLTIAGGIVLAVLILSCLPLLLWGALILGAVFLAVWFMVLAPEVALLVFSVLMIGWTCMAIDGWWARRKVRKAESTRLLVAQVAARDMYDLDTPCTCTRCARLPVEQRGH
jgi:hypothetical protein